MKGISISRKTISGFKSFICSSPFVVYRLYTLSTEQPTFLPIYHSETINNKTKAYNWGPDKITGADSVAQNQQKAFALDFKIPNFNWNLDIETFEMLPLAEGKTFAINFYDAGLDPPAYGICLNG